MGGTYGTIGFFTVSVPAFRPAGAKLDGYRIRVSKDNQYPHPTQNSRLRTQNSKSSELKMLPKQTAILYQKACFAIM
jgi:hypothetical protein